MTTDADTIYFADSLSEAVNQAATEQRMRDESEQAERERTRQETRQKEIDAFKAKLETELSALLRLVTISYDVKKILDYENNDRRVIATIGGRVGGQKIELPVYSGRFLSEEFHVGDVLSSTHYPGRGTFVPALLLAMAAAAEKAAEPKPPPPAATRRYKRIDDGGIAFPASETTADGLSKRDYFAACAMQGFCVLRSGITLNRAKCAADSYAMADAMIAERSRREELPPLEPSTDASAESQDDEQPERWDGMS